ncbi:MAG TPA: IS481 family transposase [Acidimicrobiia bacterium]|nr:IS481 family transposase [Acidimicrobiia bacterium]
MAHRNARLNVFGRRLIVQRVRQEGWAVAHAAKAMGISRQCAHRWLKRWDTEGDAGLVDRSSRPRGCPTRTPVEVEERVVEARRQRRVGPDQLSDELGVPARTISRILRRHQVPYLRECDPLTGEVIRASKTTAIRYERDRPGELIHVDVKKIGRIPPGGGWRAWGRDSTKRDKKTRIGYDYVHSAVDDHTRLAYSEILGDEKGDTTAGFLARAAEHFAAHGIGRIEAVMTDNHLSYVNSRTVRDVLGDLGAHHIRIRPHCPWQNGKVERFNRTLQTEWAYRRIYRTNDQRSDALEEWLDYYNTRRNHSSLGRRPPITRLSPT